MTRYTLPDLPYEYDALEPHISAEIMHLHHDKHHRAYVDGANLAIEKLIEAQQSGNPFRLHLSDGPHLDAIHRDFLARSPSGRTIIVCQEDDTHQVVDLLHVTRIEPLNGKKSQRRTRHQS